VYSCSPQTGLSWECKDDDDDDDDDDDTKGVECSAIAEVDAPRWILAVQLRCLDKVGIIGVRSFSPLAVLGLKYVKMMMGDDDGLVLCSRTLQPPTNPQQECSVQDDVVPSFPAMSAFPTRTHLLQRQPLWQVGDVAGGGGATLILVLFLHTFLVLTFLLRIPNVIFTSATICQPRPAATLLMPPVCRLSTIGN
jgi:hypothetical protein